MYHWQVESRIRSPNGHEACTLRVLRCSVKTPKLINISLGGALLVAAAGVLEAAPKPRPRTNVSTCGDPLGYQVQLDRRGFSPGRSTAGQGRNLQRALAAFQKANNLPDSGKVNCAILESAQQRKRVGDDRL